MGIKLKRKKDRNIKLSLAYKLFKYLPLNKKSKLKLYLDLAWIFNRLAHEQTFKTNIKVNTSPDDDFLLKKIKKSTKVLDIGCGRGYVIDRIMSKTENIVGVDYDQSSIDYAKNKLKHTKVELLCDDVFNYFSSNPKEKFDVIIMSHLLEHIDNPNEFLIKVSDKSNYFYIEVPDFENSHLNLYREAIGTDLVYTDADHVSEFDRKELEEMIESVKLEILDKEFSFGVMRYWLQSHKDKV